MAASMFVLLKWSTLLSLVISDALGKNLPDNSNGNQGSGNSGNSTGNYPGNSPGNSPGSYPENSPGNSPDNSPGNAGYGPSNSQSPPAGNSLGNTPGNSNGNPSDAKDDKGKPDQKPMPNQMNMGLKMQDKTMTLNLTMNPNIQSNFTVIVESDNGTTSWTPSDNGNDFGAYVDHNTGASVIIQQTNVSGQMTNRIVSGTVSMNGTIYSFSSSIDQRLSYDPSPNVNKTSPPVMQVDGVSYNMKKEGKDMKYFNCDDQPGKSGRQKRATAYSSNGRTSYTVDLLFVVDWSLYNQWYGLSTKTTAYEKNADAQQNIMYYFANVANGMDMRYSTIQQSDFTVNIRLVGIYIATDQSKSTFTDGYGIRLDWSGNTYTDMYQGLNSFQKWVTSFALQYGKFFDQATLFTGNILYDGTFLNGKPNAKSGLANIGSICNIGNFTGNDSLSVSINADHGIYASVETASHELAHNLGSYHDGDSNNCLSSDQYIMAVAPGSLTDANFNHPFTFSACSITYMSNFLRQFTWNYPQNCLLQQSSYPAYPSTDNTPGRRYTVDQQCQQIYGAQSFYCAGGSRDQTICKSMLCWDANQQQCTARTESRAYDGTTCGNQMWCKMGQCVSDPAAPYTLTKTCIYGNFKAQLTFSGGVMLSCSNLAGSNAYRCYDNSTSFECCQTCPALRNNSQIGCEYGDRDPNFCASNAVRSSCYDPNFNTTCCGFCARQRGNITGCEYGDKATYCSTITRDRCYTSDLDVCCETCAKLRVQPIVAGCEYGDRVTWCSQAPLSYSNCVNNVNNAGTQCCASCQQFSTPSPSTSVSCPLGDQSPSYCSAIRKTDCYSSSTSSYCCSTCSRYYTNMPGCEYGDKAGWCSSYVSQCQTDANVLSNCCQTCSTAAAAAAAAPKQDVPACTDGASWCSNLFPGYCYDSQTAQTCCAMCTNNKKSNPSCLYGDKYSWCATQYCSTNKNDCCATCA